VLAVACDHRLLAAGDTYRADALLRRVPARAWQWVSAGRGPKGHRYDDRAFIQLDDGDPSPGGQAAQRWLLVRRWRSWYRWTTLAMLAHAFLVVAALTERTRHPPPSGLIGLTCNEVQHLFAPLAARPAGDLGHRLRWSVWRRPHLPLPTTSQRTMKITIYGWSTRAARDSTTPRFPLAGSSSNPRASALRIGYSRRSRLPRRVRRPRSTHRGPAG
jgi:hypothetical protein